ncbi:hypothetical protein Scep_022013 [Stephania cephalantha]|uniref:Uncharacterized protein n=1 Tax=Stephania cephalantha TaxID=152367 RepID=A0AAP0F5D1_9MAGN
MGCGGRRHRGFSYTTKVLQKYVKQDTQRKQASEDPLIKFELFVSFIKPIYSMSYE